MTRRRSPLVATITLVVAVLATACGDSSPAEPVAVAEPAAETTTTTVTTPAIASAEREVGPAPEVVEPLPLDAEAVVTATVLIASGGDLEAAIAAGLVGEAEAEAALQALEEGGVGDLFAD